MNADFSRQRETMVDAQLRTTDVTDKALLEAMGSVPREMFVPAVLRPLAYIDEDLALDPADPAHDARYLMEPSPFAKLVQLAGVKETDRVMDIGCGTGYSAAILSRLGAHITALEHKPAFVEAARRNLSLLGIANATVVEGTLQDGNVSGAPYDVILLDGAVEDVPERLSAQLAEGGRLVAVVGRGNAAAARVYIKDRGVVTGRHAFNAAIRPLPGFEKEAAFEF